MTLSNRIQYIFASALILFYVIGLIGLNLHSVQAVFKYIIPFNILALCILVLISHKGWNTRMVLFSISVFLLGYGVELLGIKTGVIFGEYQYVKYMGPKVYGVPLLIGLNWLLMVYSTGNMVNLGWKDGGIMQKSLLGAFWMTFTDLFLENFAVSNEMWEWLNPDGGIPLQNFVAWFYISFIFQLGFHYLFPNLKNRFAAFVSVLLLLFFLAYVSWPVLTDFSINK